MKQFSTIQKLDTGILYCLELASSISVLLLAFGLIASMSNVLLKGIVLTGNPTMQAIWSVSCLLLFIQIMKQQGGKNLPCFFLS